MSPVTLAPRPRIAFGPAGLRLLAGPAARVRNSYDSATLGRRARGWSPGTLGPNAATLPNLATLRDRSHKAARDDPYGGGTLDTLVEQIVGTGIWPRSLAPDPAVRAQLKRYWEPWTRRCDADGLLDYAGLITLTTRAWLEGGEAFVRLRPRLADDGLPVPLQLQVLEPELCPLYHTAMRGANRIRAGIELSPIGRRVAFWFHRAHPADGEWTADAGTLVRLPAERVAHVFRPVRAGQLRGVPHLSRALLTLWDLAGGDDATLLRWKLGNMFMGHLSRAPSAFDTQGLDPITGQAIERDTNAQAMIRMEPGSVVDLLPGEKLEFNDPPEAGQTYDAFMRQQLRKVAVANRVPYHMLTGDMSQINDRTVRVILTDFRRAIEQLQWQVLIHQFCGPVWSAFVWAAVLAGVLPMPAAFFDDPTPWLDVEWATDRFPYIHPLQDVEADQQEIRAGLASRTQKVKARGYDSEDLDREQAADNARADALGLAFDSDGRVPKGTGVARTEGEPAAPEPEKDAIEKGTRNAAPPTVRVEAPITVVVPPARPMTRRVIRDARGLVERIDETLTEE